MMDGYKKFVGAGYKLTATSESAVEERETLIENGRTVQVFLRDNGYRSTLSAGNWKEKPKLLLASQFYNHYVDYCAQVEIGAVSMNQFGRDLRNLSYERKRCNMGNVWCVYSDVDIPYKIQ